MREQDIKLLRVLYEATQWDKGGEVVVRCGSDSGRIFFSEGKIAWAIASTIKRTFTAYLAEHTDLDQEEVKEAFEDCKRTGKNFGETIVEWGLLEESALRLLLLQHLSEILLEVFSWPVVESLFMPEERSYRGSLTFGLKEVVQTVLILDTDGKLPFAGTPVKKILERLKKQPDGDELEAIDLPEEAVRTKAWYKRGKARALGLGIFSLVLLVGGSVLFANRDRVFHSDKAPNHTEASTSSQVGSTDLSPGVLSQPEDGGLDDPKPDESKPKEQKPDENKPPEAQPPEAQPNDSQPKKAKPQQATTQSDKEKTTPAIVAGLKGKGRASIRITSKPSHASIFLDGIFTGRKTPYTLRKVSAGMEHVVLLEKKGRRPTHKRLKPRSGQKVSLRLLLKKKGKRWKGSVKVKVDSNPPGAAIYLDGKSLKKQTPTSVALRASSASKLELRRRGYKKWTRIVRPVPGVRLTFFVRLKKKP